MIQVDIPAAVRTVFGKGESRRLRMDKKTPAVVYSKGDDPVALQFDEGILYKNLLDIHGRNAVVTLDIKDDEKGKRHVLVQEIQKDPVVEQVLHVDFLEIELDKPVDFVVPLRLTGVAKGVELGGQLRVSRKTITLRGCPLDVPDEIVADITDIESGGAVISCADLEIPANLEMLDDPATVCVSVI
jgi:large subunit ribosomal protein L25